MPSAINYITGEIIETQEERRRSTRHTPNWLRAVYAVIAGLVAILALSLTLGPSTDALPPCKSENSTGCYWDADTMGNGRGHDVVSR